jgi:hypothetical protein
MCSAASSAAAPSYFLPKATFSVAFTAADFFQLMHQCKPWDGTITFFFSLTWCHSYTRVASKPSPAFDFHQQGTTINSTIVAEEGKDIVADDEK